VELLIAVNPDPDSRLPYLMRLRGARSRPRSRRARAVDRRGPRLGARPGPARSGSRPAPPRDLGRLALRGLPESQ